MLTRLVCFFFQEFHDGKTEGKQAGTRPDPSQQGAVERQKSLFLVQLFLLFLFFLFGFFLRLFFGRQLLFG